VSVPGAAPAAEVLVTPRLRLEPLEERHADVLFDGLRDELLYEFIDEAPPASLQALRERYRRLATRHSPDGSAHWLNWAVFAEAEQRYVGYVQATIAQDRPAQIGYVIFRGAWGRGYASEAVGRILRDLRETWRCADVKAVVDVRNGRSISLLQRLGFERVPTASAGDAASAGEAEYRQLP
jgi:[ribosomal protein S5]-alanine N-acetyltransferase